MTDQEYEYLKMTVLKLTGLDLDQYMSRQMRRRLQSHIECTHRTSVGSFCHDLREDPSMVQELKDFLTINVSEFFRDEPQFTYLKRVILPDLLRKSESLKIWSAGCSNGAEIYSIAMLLSDIYPLTTHDLLATDIDDSILTMAKDGGPYASRQVKNIEKWRARKYFTISQNQYWIADRIRDKVRFEKHDLMNDSYEQGFDLIVCRNVVIYFTVDAKQKLNLLFHKALKEGGVLFVGGSELIVDFRGVGFEPLQTSFYRKVATNVRAGIPEYTDHVTKDKRWRSSVGRIT
ncbi:MAG: protein-glutamate O-methyltransferase CheR [Chloroflexota bacterium]|nr:protein-glutamate O-methyltransferase CheR [Chloroflexota bacterium]